MPSITISDYAGRQHFRAAALFMMVWATSAAGQERAPAARADLIFTNARIYTVDESRPWAESVAIRDGKIVAVGSNAEVIGRKGRKTKVIDLAGRMLMPAFGDAHVHPVFGGMSRSRCSLHEGANLAQYQAIIAGCMEKAPGTGVIYGAGWSDGLFPPHGRPDKKLLDAVSKDRPLIFLSVGGHSLWLNSKALSLAGISAATPDPVNGKIDRDPATGEPSGSLQEAAMELVDAYVPKPTSAEMQSAIVYVAGLLNGLGITSWEDAGIEMAPNGDSATLDAYKAVLDRGALTGHVSIALKWDNARSVEQIPALIAASARARRLGLSARTVKFYVDGVIPQHTAFMLAPYENAGTDRGAAQIPAAILNRAVSGLDAHGIQAHVHAIGDGAVREALDAFEHALNRNGGKGHRPMISHMNVVDPSDQPRFGALGAIAVFQPTWASNYEYMDLTKRAVGPERSKAIYPANSIARAGGRLAYGSDWPVGPVNPLEGLEVAVTRRINGDAQAEPLLPSEGVTLAQAVKAYTLNVAYANRMDKITGSIAVGKSADLIVLDENIFELPVQRIAKAKVLVTLFKGKPVFGTLDGTRR